MNDTYLLARKLIERAFLVLAFGFICSCNPQHPMSTADPGVSLALAEWRKNTIDSLSYELFFQIPEAKADSIPAEATIRFFLEEVSGDLPLDFQALTEQLQHLSANQSTVPIRFVDEHVWIPAEFLREGANEITIAFIAGDLSLNRKEDFLYTLLVPDRARTLFPCFDQPNLKASFQLSLEIPSDWEALANGELEREEEKNGRKRLDFVKTEPISTYLFAFTAGRFQRRTRSIDGRQMSMLYRESDEEKVARNLDDIFRLHADALTWLEDYTALPLAFPKFDFALIPGFQYGGMEHVGAIFYRESSLMLDENATTNQQIGRASLIAHETAHMWFGDLVTMEWFDDVWLKEVFANFMAAKIVNPAFPEINHDLNFLLRHQPAAYGEDRSGGTHPIQQKLENLNEAGTLYGRIIYQKAPVVMRMLEERLGEEKLQQGLQEYLKRYAYGNASWDDLIQILDQSTDDDLSGWSTAWVKRAGMPTYVIEANPQEDQQALLLNYSFAGPDTVVREQVIELALFYPDTIQRLSLPLTRARRAPERIEIPAPPQAILCQTKPSTYGYFPFDARSREWMLVNVHSIEDDLLRTGAWLSLYEDFLNQEISTERFYSALFPKAIQEENTLLRNYLLNRLQEVYWRYLTVAEREQLGPELERQLVSAFLQTDKPSDAIAYFQTYYAIVETANGMEHLSQIWQSEKIRPDLPLSETEAIELAAELSLRLGIQDSTLLMRQLERTKNQDRRARLEYILPALSPDKTVRDTFFAGLAEVENRATEPWTVDAVRYLHHPLRAATALPYIEPSLELLQEIQATGDIFFPRQFITATLEGHSSLEAAVVVRQFLKERPNYPPRLRNKILMAADALFRATR